MKKRKPKCHPDRKYHANWLCTKYLNKAKGSFHEEESS